MEGLISNGDDLVLIVCDFSIHLISDDVCDLNGVVSVELEGICIEAQLGLKLPIHSDERELE